MIDLKNYGVDDMRIAQASAYPELELARVVAQYNNIYRIAAVCGELPAEVSGRFRHLADAPAEYPAVGDFVMASFPDNSNAVIHAVLPRKSVFERRAAGTASFAQVVAANIDIVFICMSLNANYNPSRLERYLAVSWSSGATPVIVLTKADLCANLPAAIANAQLCASGADVVSVTNSSEYPAAPIMPYLKKGVTASFIGSSGVGKSTLINAALGEQRISVAGVRSDDKGRHTTTRRELFVLANGAVVIDTPGMRELGAESVDLQSSFSDIDALAEMCKFRDCTHESEPGCAVLRAIEDGTLEQRRLDNYRKLKREARYEGLDSRQLENEKFASMFKDVGGMKKIRKYNRENDKRK